jgi:hypothetical protein
LSLFGEFSETKEDQLELEILTSTFNLLVRQEAKKLYPKKLASYTIDISFSEVTLSTLIPSEIRTFTSEFKKILTNYLDEIDLFCYESPVHYRLLLMSKKEKYAQDMTETLKYNINKVLNDNFQDPEHSLEIITTQL